MTGVEAHGSRAELCCQHLGAHPLQAMKIPQQAELVDEDAMSQIRKGHDTMCVVLTSRHKNLDTVRAVWTTGDIKASTTSALGLGLNQEEVTQENETVGAKQPRPHAVTDFISATIINTSCHLLSTYLWASPCPRHLRCSLINTPQSAPSPHHTQQGPLCPVPS